MASNKGLGRTGKDMGASFETLVRGEGGGETAVFSLMPSFHAGGEAAWKRSWPFSSESFAGLVLAMWTMAQRQCARGSFSTRIWEILIRTVCLHQLILPNNHECVLNCRWLISV